MADHDHAKGIQEEEVNILDDLLLEIDHILEIDPIQGTQDKDRELLAVAEDNGPIHAHIQEIGTVVEKIEIGTPAIEVSQEANRQARRNGNVIIAIALAT